MTAKNRRSASLHQPKPTSAIRIPGSPPKEKGDGPSTVEAHGFWSRDNIENILVAIVLALLFRAFEAEAFVIPTGSMAPTLMGRHKDIRCEECGCRFQVGETDDAAPEGWSLEAQRQRRFDTRIAQVVCPTCRFPTDTRPRARRFRAYNGDRILVNKFAYQTADPQRWDVIVFKYPGNAKQNYIKRLVGLPNETLRIEHGDVYAGPDRDHLKITRKPAHKLARIMQLVHDTEHIAPRLRKLGWPSAWFAAQYASATESAWTVDDTQQIFRLDQPAGHSDDGEPAWLRFRHLLPSAQEWSQVRKNRLPDDIAERKGCLVTDYYAYNSWYRPGLPVFHTGWYWVGDLAVEANVQVRGGEGELLLDLVEAGRHHTCSIDVRTGKAIVQIDDGKTRFESLGPGPGPLRLEGQTSIQRPGRYQLRFSNVDNQLLLWVDDKLVSWNSDEADHSGGYSPGDEEVPRWSAEDPGDLNPVGVGGKNIQVTLDRLRVLRDVYYVAVKSGVTEREEYRVAVDFFEVQRIMSTPEEWDTSELFSSRGAVEFELGDDQFFPMGDNSPFSKDARLWGGWEDSLTSAGKVEVKPWVDRDLLIGKAFLVYWPHGWDLGPLPVRLFPNVQRMNRIQ